MRRKKLRTVSTLSFFPRAGCWQLITISYLAIAGKKKDGRRWTTNVVGAFVGSSVCRVINNNILC